MHFWLRTLTRAQYFIERQVMYPRLIRYHLLFSGVLLLLTAVAKLISAEGSALILQYPDPIFRILFRQVFWLLGIIELAVALVCLFSQRLGLQIGLVAWLATDFVVYRLGLVWIGYHKPCSCLGNLTDALHIQPQTADTVMKIILVYLLLGSYATLFWLWRQKRKTQRVNASSTAPITPI